MPTLQNSIELETYTANVCQIQSLSISCECVFAIEYSILFGFGLDFTYCVDGTTQIQNYWFVDVWKHNSVSIVDLYKYM